MREEGSDGPPEPELAQAVAAVVDGDAGREARPHVLHAEPGHEELRELPGAAGSSARFPPLLVLREQLREKTLSMAAHEPEPTTTAS